MNEPTNATDFATEFDFDFDHTFALADAFIDRLFSAPNQVRTIADECADHLDSNGFIVLVMNAPAQAII